MANRFKDLNNNSNDNEGSKRENIFKSKENLNSSRVVTGKSLKELITHSSSQGKQEKQEKQEKPKKDNFNYKTKNRYHNEKKNFSKPVPVIKEEFKVNNNEFPDLVEGKTQEERVKTLDYKEKIQMVKEEAIKERNILPYGWVFLSKKRHD